jgi:hypothetical protein
MQASSPFPSSCLSVVLLERLFPAYRDSHTFDVSSWPRGNFLVLIRDPEFHNLSLFRFDSGLNMEDRQIGYAQITIARMMFMR